MNKEQWVNEVLESTTGMHRAAPHPGLFDRVTALANGHRHHSAPIPARKWVAAAILLVILNVGSILYALDRHRDERNTVASNTLFSDIQTGSSYNY